MQPRQDGDEQQPEAPSDDSKALVAALAQQLAVRGEISSLDATTSSAAPEALNRESTGNHFSTYDLRDRESVSLSPPSFLGDQQVRHALQRAKSLRPQGHLDDEPYFPSALSDAFQYLPGGGRENRDARVPRNIVAYEDRSYPSTSSGYFVPHTVPPSSTPSYPQDALKGSSGVSGKFKPGQETESVLKLTKRPKLRRRMLLIGALLDREVYLLPPTQCSMSPSLGFSRLLSWPPISWFYSPLDRVRWVFRGVPL
jgi:hypothetical protein